METNGREFLSSVYVCLPYLLLLVAHPPIQQAVEKIRPARV